MEKQNGFMNVVVRKFAGARRRPPPRPPEPPPSPSLRGDVVRALPAFRSADFNPPRADIAELKRTEVRAPQSSPWSNEHCANEPRGFFPCGEQDELWARRTKIGRAWSK